MGKLVLPMLIKTTSLPHLPHSSGRLNASATSPAINRSIYSELPYLAIVEYGHSSARWLYKTQGFIKHSDHYFVDNTQNQHNSLNNKPLRTKPPIFLSNISCYKKINPQLLCCIKKYIIFNLLSNITRSIIPQSPQ